MFRRMTRSVRAAASTSSTSAASPGRERIHVRGRERGLGAAAHRHADRGARHRGGVVDAVAHHDDGALAGGPLDLRELLLGRTSPRQSPRPTPSAPPTAATTSRASPERMRGRQPRARSAATTPGASARTRSPKPAAATSRPSTATQTGVSARGGIAPGGAGGAPVGARPRRTPARRRPRARPATRPSTPPPHGRARTRGAIGASSCGHAAQEAGGDRDGATPARARRPAAWPTSGPYHAASASAPSVSVPVLSSTIVAGRARRSSASPPVIRMPARAARPMATVTASGVASASAQGQVTMSRAIALSSARLGSTCRANTSHVTAARTQHDRDEPRRPGGRPAHDRRAPRGARLDLAHQPADAALLARAARPSRGAAAARLTVPAHTGRPGTAATGRDSPVSSDASTRRLPRARRRRRGSVSPARTSTSMPGSSASAGTSRTAPSPSTRRAVARRERGEQLGRRRPPARWARCCRNRPTSSRKTSMATPSK